MSAQLPPLPWGINDDGDVVDEGGELVAINPRLGSFPAHLIAAAPELYDAASAVLAWVVENRFAGPRAARLRDALAKARGEQ